MSDTPERIWLDWLRANSRDYAYDEPPIKPNDDCKDAYIRLDLYDALKAENERLRTEKLLSQPLYSRRQLEEQLAAAELKIKELEGKAAEAYEKGWDDRTERAFSDMRAEAERDY